MLVYLSYLYQFLSHLISQNSIMDLSDQPSSSKGKKKKQYTDYMYLIKEVDYYILMDKARLRDVENSLVEIRRKLDELKSSISKLSVVERKSFSDMAHIDFLTSQIDHQTILYDTHTELKKTITRSIEDGISYSNALVNCLD